MKTNIKRLGALIIVGSIATLTASAADTNNAAEKAAAPKADATAQATPAAASTAKSTAANATHIRARHSAKTAARTEQSKLARAKDGLVWFGAVAQNATTPPNIIHRTANDVQLTKVVPGSPAYKAGLRPGDVIWKFDGERLKNTGQLQRELRQETPGEQVPVEIFRDGKREDFNVKLGASQAARSIPARSLVLIIG